MDIKRNCKDFRWVAGLSALLCGVITHGFALVTMLHNNDDIAQQPYGYGTGLSSGRWLLTVLGDFLVDNGFGYNLPLVNGLLFLLLIAMTATVTVSVLQIRNRKSAAMVGMLFAVFPSVAGTLFFRYTVVYYGLSLLLSVLAVWVLENHRHGLILSAVCLALSMGIYQAYVPMTIALFVLLLIRGVLKRDRSFWETVRKGLYYCGVLLLGLVIYYLALRCCLALYETELSDYNGVNSMGKLSVSMLPSLLKEALYSPLLLPVKDYCALAGMRSICLAYAGIYLISCCVTGYILLRYVKKPLQIVLTAVLAVLLLLSVNFIVIMCPDGWIYTIMVYPFVLLGCLPLMLWECVPETDPVKNCHGHLPERIMTAVLCLLIFSYGYETNVNYTASYYANRQTENYLNSIVVQVRMTEGFDAQKKWAFLGSIDDPLLHTPWRYSGNYGGNEPAYMLINRETRPLWIWHYYGYSIPFVSQEQSVELWASEEVAQMPCWPDHGSIRAIGDVMVVKFQEYSPQ